MQSLLRLWRAIRWKARHEAAIRDVHHNRSGVRFYVMELRRAQAKLAAIEAERVNIHYPPPKAVGRSV